MALIKGKQLGTGANGVQTANLQDSSITSAKINDAAIIAAKLAAGSVEAAALASASVSTIKIQDAAITTAKINDASITTAKLASGAVDNAALALLSVATGNVQDSAITTAKLNDASVSSAKIIDASITTAKINDAAVTGAKILDGAISSAKLASGSVDTTALGASAVTAAKIASSAVGTAAIAANAVTSAKVDSSIIVASGANAFSAAQSMGGFKLTNVGMPSADGDAANKAYVDSMAQGLTDFKQSVRAVSTTALAGTFMSNTLVASGNGALSIDGVAMAAGNRVLLAGQSSASQNGIYTVTTAGSGASAWALLRATDADSSAEVTAGMYMYVSEGSSYANSAWVLSTADVIVLNTTSLSFVQFSGAGQLTAGAGLAKSGNTLDVQVDGTTLEISSDALRIAAGAAGAGLTGGGGSALAVGAGAGISVSSDAIAVLFGAMSDISAAAAGGSKAAGVLDSAARTDHSHSFPTAAAVAVGSANAEGSSSSFARADHVHAAPSESGANKGMTASVTSANGDVACATGLSAAPALSGYAAVIVNGLQYVVGNGVKTKDCYFSADLGSTAKATNALASGDKLYWNGSIAGFQLDASDVVDFNFMAF